MRNARTRASEIIVGVAVGCVLAAPVASSYPDEFGPFEGKTPRVVRTFPCRAAGADDPSGAVTYARGGRHSGGPRVRLEQDAKGAVSMSVVDADGGLVAGPRRISDRRIAIPPAFWADLNGDGREDFIALVVTALGEEACECDVGFALSSKEGYRITGVRATRGPGSNDFLDLGSGRAGFIHTALVERRDPARPEAAKESFFVYSLLEVRGDRLCLAEADPRFPRWVRLARGPRPAEGPTLADAEKRRLYSEVAGSIFRGARATTAPAVASAPE